MSKGSTDSAAPTSEGPTDAATASERVVATDADGHAAVTDRFDHAAAALDREYRRTKAELEALESFIDEVGSLSPTSSSVTAAASRMQLRPSQPGGLDAVREAYRSTMMTVPHYEEEYDESYAEHVRHELGPDVATLLTSGQVFERHHKQVVIAAANDARARRGQLLTELDRERDSLADLREPVCGVAADVARLESITLAEQPAEMLDGYHTRLGVLDSRCHDLIDRRQSALVSQRRSMSLSLGGPDIATCVYSDLETDYPVVATLTELLDRIEELVTDVEHHLR
jgi:hypothetical protein